MTANAAEELIRKVEDFVRAELCNAPGCHDFDHTARVLRNALDIQTMEQRGDRIAIHLAALLHDIARPEEMAADGKVCHASLGADKADAVLLQCGLQDDALRRTVTEAVRRHRYRTAPHPETIEEMIVYDADKLDSIGAVGIGRAFHFAGRIGARLHNTAEEAVNSPAYGIEDSAYREYLVKLRHVPERMLTPTGRRLAEDRARFMHEFFARLNIETYGIALN